MKRLGVALSAITAVFCMLLATGLPCWAGFTDIGAALTGLSNCSLAWGDYDNDGDLDLAAAGYNGIANVSKIYRNDNGQFTDIQAPLTGVQHGSLAWGDYDSDGDLDLAVAGSGTSKVYRNDNGCFVDVLPQYLVPVSDCSLAWGDYEHNGQLDLAVAGATLSGSTTIIYWNNKGVFGDIGAWIWGLTNASVAWADYDNDGKLDLAVCGAQGNVPVTKICHNNFREFPDIGANLTGVKSGALAWADYDNDGDLDLAVSGATSSTSQPRVSKIYRNDGGTFTDTGAALTGVANSALAWGDYDNDGDVDLAIAGNDGTAASSKIYRNDGGVFTDAGESLANIENGSLAWGDYDKDGDLDLALAGGGVTKIYRNDQQRANTPPTPPAGLSASYDGWVTYLTWDAASDAQTPTAGLSYNIRVGTTPGGGDVFSGMADGSTGLRRLPAIGNAQKKLTWEVVVVPKPALYCSVQAIDASYAASAWSTTVVHSFKISGHVRPVPAVKGTYIEPAISNQSTFTDEHGYYELWLPVGWSGKVTPSKSGVSFVPASRSYCGLSSDQGNQDYAPTMLDTGLSLPGAYDGEIAWGDYDNDGDLDLAIAGSGTGTNSIGAIYRNDSGVFVDIGANILGVTGCSLAWGDYDNDGDLDLALSGSSDTGVTSRIYRNDNGVFTDSGAALIPVWQSNLAWGDYDNDGDLDLAVTGYNGTEKNVTKIYRNDNGAFVSINANLMGLSGSSLAWGDYDNDGDLDLILTGEYYDTRYRDVTKLYRNDNGTFVDTGANLLGLRGSVAWGDYDNDGDLDLAITGIYYTDVTMYQASKIYRNDNGSFVDTASAINNQNGRQVAWADYDNDGDLDLTMMVYTAPYASIVKIYRNTNGTFADSGIVLPEVTGGCFAWGDYNNDGNLDLAVTGDFDQRVTKIYFFNLGVANTPPTAPHCLSATYTASGLTLSWLSSQDAQTPAAGLSYNIRVGSTPGGCDVFSGMADASTGLRRLPALGNTQKKRMWTLRTLPSKPSYYCSVQAIDTAYAGSPWSAESSVLSHKISGHLRATSGTGGFAISASHISSAIAVGDDGYYELFVPHGWSGTVTPSDPSYWFTPADRSYSNVTSDMSDQDFYAFAFTNTGAALIGMSNCCFAWGDYDNDGDLDLAAAGYTGSTYVSKIYRNDSTTFVDSGIALPGVQNCSLAWGDYDNDGDLDLAIAGSTGSANISKVYRNDAGTFTDIGAALAGVQNCSLAWGDYDNDGDLDLAIAGYTGSAVTSKIYRNDGGAFTDIGAALTAVQYCSLAWGDYDNDGDLDLALAGYTGSTRITKIYRNDGGTFADIGAALTGVQMASVAWGDYDSDGDLDLAIAGYCSVGSVRVTQVYRNDNGTFTDIGAPLTGVQSAGLAWGDYDNDGDLDLAISGLGPTSSTRTSKIYRNDAGTFTDTGLPLPGLSASSVAWGDYDNDGRLDLAIAGYGGTAYTASIYRNDGLTATNTAPSAPTDLSANLADNALTLTWNAAADAQTPVLGLSYNVRIGSVPGGCDVFSGTADASTGMRRLPALGNAQKKLSWTIKNLPSTSNCYCSVQAIDTSYAGSAWATESVVKLDSVPPSIISVYASPVLVAASDLVHVTVNATDNISVSSITANGIALSKSGAVWTGDIPADAALGMHSVAVEAADGAANKAADSSASYRTASVYGLIGGASKAQAMSNVFGLYLFKVWGKVTKLDTDGFLISDGSITKVKIIAPGCTGIAVDDFVSARGILDPTGETPTLTCPADKVTKLN